jgi:hypothetical protein
MVSAEMVSAEMVSASKPGGVDHSPTGARAGPYYSFKRYILHGRLC